MASVSLRAVTKVFAPPTRVLDEVTLEVADGEFLAILGPSGCGKSTVLRCLAGLEPVTSGDLFIGDRRVNDLPPAERDAAMVFQNYALYPHLTVRQNLEFPLRMRRTAQPRREELVREAASRLELDDLLDRMPAQLSGGQRQRVALGRALVRQPQVFLFDEPLSNLDAALRVQLRSELIGLHAAIGATMLYVTHDQVEALTMGERVAVMHAGRLLQVGTPAEIYGRPRNTFVAGFVGAPGMNLLKGTRTDDGVFAAGGLSFPDAPAGAVTLGVRPEHLHLTLPGQGLGDAEVSTVERLGSETLVHARVAGGQVVIIRLPGLAESRVGDRAGLRAEPGAWHWFASGGEQV